jgi:predicted DNA-binding antitoxin AbrB/MazE fold protein
MTFMEIQGHYHNGLFVPENSVSLPDGTAVTITVRQVPDSNGPAMSADERDRYLAALTRIDGLSNENPGDAFSGADHDRVLYDNKQ